MLTVSEVSLSNRLMQMQNFSWGLKTLNFSLLIQMLSFGADVNFLMFQFSPVFFTSRSLPFLLIGLVSYRLYLNRKLWEDLRYPHVMVFLGHQCMALRNPSLAELASSKASFTAEFHTCKWTIVILVMKIHGIVASSVWMTCQFGSQSCS